MSSEKGKTALSIGDKVLGDWEIIGKLGEGAFGKVYEIQKKEYGLKAALKILSLSKTDAEDKDMLWAKKNDDSLHRYYEDVLKEVTNEIALMTKLKGHDHIVNCEDYSVIEYADGGGWDIYIRMELLTPLQKYLQNYTLREPEVIKLGIDLCQALSACQKMGVLHRDIKPANIFVTKEGSAKLGDFGIARSIEKVNVGLSRKGTVNYMAPEIFRGEAYGSAVDIYSLGVVLYMLMNNYRMPFYPEEPQPVTYRDQEISFDHRMNGKDMPAPINASKEFSSVIMKACAFRPEDRYSSAEEMMKALKRIQGDGNGKNVFNQDETLYFDFVEIPSGETETVYLEKNLPKKEKIEEKVSTENEIEVKEPVRHEKKSTNGHKKIIAGCIIGVVVLLGAILMLKPSGSGGMGSVDPFAELERIYVYSEYNFGVSAFQEAVEDYHVQLQEASDAQYQEFHNIFKDDPDILQGIETFEEIRNSGEAFVEYGPCALYQNEDGDARVFQLLKYENGYVMMECGFNTELEQNYMGFYRITNLSGEDEADVVFTEEDYKLKKL